MRRVLKYSLGFILLLLISVAVLTAFFGLRFELDGTGMRPMVRFEQSDRHYEELEKRSAEDRASAAAEIAQTEPSSPSVPVSAPPPAAEPTSGQPAAPAKAASAPWPFFYGPRLDGRYTGGPILTDWPAKGLEPLWRRPIGGGYASMTVAGGKVFTIEQRREQETAAAYDLATGKELWVSQWPAFFKESMGGDGPRATPVYNEGRVYALGAEGEFRCLDASSGRTVWRVNILEGNGAENVTWGMAASPLIVDGQVIVLPGGPAGKSVASYDKLTGKPLWTALDDKAAYVAPMVATLAGQRQLVIVTAKRALGLALDGARVLWEHPWVTEYDVNSTLPVIAGPNRVLLSSGYGHGSALLEIDENGARQVWVSQAMKAKFNNVVLKDGVIYGLDEGILAAMDAATGQRKWKGGRYGYGQLLLAGEHLVVLTEEGDVVLVKASPERHEELARFTALEGKTWNVPAIAEGRLLVRNQTEMAAFRIGR